MSAQEERDTLTPPTAPYDHALRLLRDSPAESRAGAAAPR